ncbi:MAG: hypothetical protein ACU83O_01030, partial [Gammaproteobacteria bacterium]
VKVDHACERTLVLPLLPEPGVIGVMAPLPDSLDFNGFESSTGSMPTFCLRLSKVFCIGAGFKQGLAQDRQIDKNQVLKDRQQVADFS